MSATVFDTHAIVKKLKAAGFTEQQAEASAETLADAISGQVATKADLNEAALKVENRITKIEADIGLLKWMVGFNLAFSAGILAKLLA